MNGTHKTPGPRLAKLERFVRERPCPVCGRVYSLHKAVVRLPEMARLDAGEQRELIHLLGVAATEPCVRCGRSSSDIARLTDDQKRRTLALLHAIDPRNGKVT